jgi:hypothetical protein
MARPWGTDNVSTSSYSGHKPNCLLGIGPPIIIYTSSGESTPGIVTDDIRPSLRGIGEVWGRRLGEMD